MKVNPDKVGTLSESNGDGLMLYDSIKFIESLPKTKYSYFNYNAYNHLYKYYFTYINTCNIVVESSERSVMKAKDTLSRLLEKKKKSEKINVTLSIDKKLYMDVKKHLKSKELMVSEFVEEFFRELLGKE